MLCQQCQLDVQDGKPYVFYYGNQTGKVRRGRQTITSYQISGSQQPFFCNKCVFTFAMKERAKGFLQGATFFFVLACIGGFFAFFVLDPNNAVVFWFAAALLLAYALSLVMTSLVERKRAENHDFETLSAQLCEESGSKLGIALNKSTIISAGFKEFFTPSRMKQLRR